jgi:hypothetical protein
MSSPIRRAAKRRDEEKNRILSANEPKRMREWIQTFNDTTFFCWEDDDGRRHTTATHQDQDFLEGAAKVLRGAGYRVTVAVCKSDPHLFALNGVISKADALKLEPPVESEMAQAQREALARVVAENTEVEEQAPIDLPRGHQVIDGGEVGLVPDERIERESTPPPGFRVAEGGLEPN